MFPLYALWYPSLLELPFEVWKRWILEIASPSWDLTKVWPRPRVRENLNTWSKWKLLDSLCTSCSALWALGVVWLLSYNSSILFDPVVCNSSQARPKMTMKMRTTIEILTPHAQHYDNFLQNFWAYCSRHGRECGKAHFYGGPLFTWL